MVGDGTEIGVVQTMAACPFCGAAKVVRAGRRKTRAGVRQLFRCNACWRRFSCANPTACRTPPHAIRRALALGCQGYTYDEVLRFLAARLRCRVTKGAVSKWVRSFDEEDYFSFDPTPSLLQDVACEREDGA